VLINANSPMGPLKRNVITGEINGHSLEIFDQYTVRPTTYTDRITTIKVDGKVINQQKRRRLHFFRLTPVNLIKKKLSKYAVKT
jgi:hypothetical protein